MAVMSRIIEDWSDADEVADAVTVLGRSASAPPCFEYEEAVKPVNIPQEPPNSPPKRKRHNRKRSRRKTSKQKDVVPQPKKEDVVPVVVGPLIINGACAPRPSRAEISTVQEEESAAGPEYTVVSMADGSQFSFPAAPSAHNHAESSSVHYGTDSQDPSQIVNETPWQPPVQEEPSHAYVAEGAGEPAGQSLPSSHFHSYSLGAHQAHTSSVSYSHVRGTASDPGHPGHLYSPEHSYANSHSSDNGNYSPKETAMSPGAREYSAGSPSQDRMSTAGSSSSVTEPGSPSLRPSGHARNEQSVSTTSHHDDSSVSTSILPLSLQRTSNNVGLSGGAAPHHFSSANNVTYIILDDDSRETSTNEQLSADMRADNVEMPPLSNHLQNMYASGKYSDTQIILNSASEMFWSITFNAHRVVIAHSPVLNSMLERQTALEQSKSIVYLMAAKKFSLPGALEFAIQNLYDMPLIDKARVNRFTRKALGWDRGDAPDNLVSEKIKEVSMDLALCYGAAGAFLSDTTIVNAGFELALHLFDWNNLETALHFGLYPEDFLLSFDTSNDEASKKKRGNKGKKKNAAKRAAAEAQLPPLHDNLNDQVVKKWAPKFASAAIQWLVNNLPKPFHFDRLAFSKFLHDRIPHNLRTGSLASLNPSLTSLTFGHHPQPSLNCTRASAILLALPFWRFREALEKMRQKGMLNGELIKALLQEREDRRVHALREYAKKAPSNSSGKGKGKGSKDKGDKNKKEYPACFRQELGYREFAIQVQMRVEEVVDEKDAVVATHEYSLHREWMGYSDKNGGQEGVIRKFRQ